MTTKNGFDEKAIEAMFDEFAWPEGEKLKPNPIEVFGKELEKNISKLKSWDGESKIAGVWFKKVRSVYVLQLKNGLKIGKSSRWAFENKNALSERLMQIKELLEKGDNFRTAVIEAAAKKPEKAKS